MKNCLKDKALLKINTLLESEIEENWSLAFHLIRNYTVENDNVSKLFEEILSKIIHSPPKVKCCLENEYLKPLKDLKEISLINQKIQKIPLSIWRLKNLKILNLYENYITEIPAQISGSQNLTELDLGVNRLRDLPKEIGYLEKLEYLNLVKNQLEKIPESLGNLKNLRCLILTLNPLKQLPENMGKLKSLEVLFLAGMPLQKLPETTEKLKRLQHLSLANLTADFNWSDALSKLSYLPDLQILNLSNNQIKIFPEEIRFLSKVHKINLSQNALSFEEKKQIEAWLPNTRITF